MGWAEACRAVGAVRQTRNWLSRRSGWAKECRAVGALGQARNPQPAISPVRLGGSIPRHGRRAEAYRAVSTLGQAQRVVIPQPKAMPWVCGYP